MSKRLQDFLRRAHLKAIHSGHDGDLDLCSFCAELVQEEEEGAKVVNLAEYRDKKEREPSYLLVSGDGQSIYDPEEFVLVEVSTREQEKALYDGNLAAFEELGGEIYNLNPGEIVE